MSRESIELLKKLISTPSFSKEEENTKTILQDFFSGKGIETKAVGNNIRAVNKRFNPELPTVMLNSHHDTVKPNSNWTRDPFYPEETEGKLYGLGSNDAGASLVSMISVFCDFYNENLSFNLLFAASAEEEITGNGGFSLLLKELPEIQLGIVGEPTLMNAAIAEKGLLVINAKAIGKPGHAARNEGINAIDIAISDIETLKNLKLEKTSEFLGDVKFTVTCINAGSQHNVIPGECSFVIDVRINENYSNIEVFEILQKNLKSELTARSFKLNSSKISTDHKIVDCCRKLGMNLYGSPTTSDQVSMQTFPTIKIGPGDSARSHTPNEFVYTAEIEQAEKMYKKLLLLYSDSIKNSGSI